LKKKNILEYQTQNYSEVAIPSIIHSHLTYCLSSWGSATVLLLPGYHIEILTNRPTAKKSSNNWRTILFKNIRTSSKPLFFQLQLLN